MKKVSENKFLYALISEKQFIYRSIYVNLLGDQYDDFDIKAITLKDGTVLNCVMSDLSNRESIFTSGGGGSSSLIKSHTCGNFSKILDVSEIKSVTICNENINLEK